MPGPDDAYVNVYGRDVTRIRAATAKMEDYAKFPEENPNPVMRVTQHGKVLVANDPARQIAGFIVDKDGEVLTPELGAALHEVVASGSSGEVEVRVEDGRVFLVSFSHVDGRNYLNAYGRDITEERAAKFELEKVNQDLEQRVANRTASWRTAWSVL